METLGLQNSCLGIPIVSPFPVLHFPQCIIFKRWNWHPPRRSMERIWRNGKSNLTRLSNYLKEESLGHSPKEWVGRSSAGNQAELPHHWPVDIPKGPFLTIQNFPFCLILFPINPERVKRGRGSVKCLYFSFFFLCLLSSSDPAPRG